MAAEPVSQDFAVRSERIDPSSVLVAVTGELDIATTPELRDVLNAAMAAGATRLLVDLTDVTFLDSISLACLLQARRQVRERMAVVVAKDSYARLIFEVAGLPPQLALFETRAAAMHHIAA